MHVCISVSTIMPMPGMDYDDECTITIITITIMTITIITTIITIIAIGLAIAFKL